jgi:DNA-binding XRE family transcriptional regulator
MDDIRMKPAIGERIKHLRNNALMTQDGLAAAAGVSTDVIRELTEGRAYWPFTQLRKDEGRFTCGFSTTASSSRTASPSS